MSSPESQLRTGLVHTNCPFCSDNNSTAWACENGFSAVKCLQCGFIYVNPRPPLESIDEAAQTGLHKVEGGVMNVVEREGFNERKVMMFKERITEMFPGNILTSKPIDWLDVGSGWGELLVAVRAISHPDSHVEGIEPCAPKHQEVLKRGIKMSNTPLNNITMKYDVVSLINVFSHLPDPRGFMQTLAQFLKPGGYLLVVTGNGADVDLQHYPDKLFLPDHLCFAGKEHIEKIFEDLGLSLFKTNTYPYFITEPAHVRLIKNSLPLMVMRNVYRKLQGRPTINLFFKGPFRFLFVCARKPE